MSVIREPSDWDPADDAEALEPFFEHKRVRRATAQLGHGAFLCPSCHLPLVPPSAVPVSASVECPFCGVVRPARHFLRLAVADTALNTVQVRARIPLG